MMQLINPKSTITPQILFFFWPWALNPGHCPEGSGIAVRGIEAMAGKQISTQAIAYKSHTPERIEIHRL